MDAHSARHLGFPHAVRQQRRRRVLFFRLVLIAVGLVIGVGVGEIGLRLVNYQGIGTMKKDPVLGHRYRAGFDALQYNEEAKRTVKISINSLGFRDLERAVDANGKHRVAFLGDSLVAGFAVDFDDNMSQVTEGRLRAGSSDPWEVMNFGVVGFGTAQAMLTYQEVARELGPKAVVLLFFVGNDVSDNSSELSTNPRVYFHVAEGGKLVREPQSDLRRGLSAFLNDHSRFYVWQKRQTNVLAQLVKTKVVVNPVHRVFLASKDATVERAWATTFALIAELRRQVEADDARFVLFYLPFSDEVNLDWWEETVNASPPLQKERWDLAGPERRLRQFCESEGIDFISAREELKAAYANSGERFYFKHGHLNERGHAMVGDRVAAWLLEPRDPGGPLSGV